MFHMQVSDVTRIVTFEVAYKQTSTKLSVSVSLPSHSHQANILQFTPDLEVEERQTNELLVLTFLCRKYKCSGFSTSAMMRTPINQDGYYTTWRQGEGNEGNQRSHLSHLSHQIGRPRWTRIIRPHADQLASPEC
jgi:hypothetical protein